MDQSLIDEDHCSWCKQEIGAGVVYVYHSEVTRLLYFFDSPACMRAFQQDARWDNS